MRVFLGPYKQWYSPYDIARLLKYTGLHEEVCYDIGKKLDKTWLRPLCEYIYSKRKRTIKIKLHDYDTWNLDGTLALIIAPCLKQLKETMPGSPSNLDQNDVPENLRCPPEKIDAVMGVPSEYLHPQWEWIMDEMIWAFESIINNDSYELSDEEAKRQTHGLMMFGKYYTGLWD